MRKREPRTATSREIKRLYPGHSQFMYQDSHVNGKPVAGVFEVEGAERLNAFEALGDGVAMHAQALGHLFDVAPVFQVDFQGVEHPGAFMYVVIARDSSDLFQVEIAPRMVAREGIEIAVRAQFGE